MAKKDKNKYNKPQASQSSNTAQATSLGLALQKAKSGITSIPEEIQNSIPNAKFDFDLNQVNTLEKAEPEKKVEIENLLAEISESARRVRDMHEDVKKRSEDLSRKEDAFSRRSDENKKRTEDLHQLDNELKQRQVEINKSESSLANKERELEVRELDARSGFAAQNLAALKSLKIEIVDLESKKAEAQLSLFQAEQKALDDESVRTSELMRREAEIASKERVFQQQQRRLDADWKELERKEAQIHDEAMQKTSREIKRLMDANKIVEAKLDKAYAELDFTEQKLEEYRDFSSVLAGRSAGEVLDELASCNRKITQLENIIASSQDNNLVAENKSIRVIRDELKAQVDEKNVEIAEKDAQLHRLRLGVSDKEMLEKEKRALEKHIQILSARMYDLGKTVDDLSKSQHADMPFPQMSWMDSASSNDWINERNAKELKLDLKPVPNLKEFAIDLQQRIAQAEEDAHLYFGIDDIRSLIAGLSMSQLHIFQGISGTGKTSLAKAFVKSIGGNCTDIAVQAGWRDRDDLLGHYNAFEKRFYEKDCLQGLYRAQTDEYKDRCNIILLDEMNLSRPEQYFAEFLSALEKNDPKERVISLSESALPHPPKLLVEQRRIKVPKNIWFIGTANHDETTNEFADKTYDRAHVMTLPRHESVFKVEVKQKSAFSYSSLMEQFDSAVKSNLYEVEDVLEELTTGPISKILQDRFSLGWGNRFERQAKRFVPVYMATGGLKEDALDHMLASRIFRRGKVTGRYDATIEDLTSIEEALITVWKNWKSQPKRSMELLIEDRRQKERGA